MSLTDERVVFKTQGSPERFSAEEADSDSEVFLIEQRGIERTLVAVLTKNERAPGIYEIDTPEDMPPSHLAMLASAAFQTIALNDYAARRRSKVFTTVRVDTGDFLRDHDRVSYLEQSLGLTAMAMAKKDPNRGDEVIMIGDAETVSGSAGHVLHASNITRTNE